MEHNPQDESALLNRAITKVGQTTEFVTRHITVKFIWFKTDFSKDYEELHKIVLHAIVFML